MKRNKRSKAGKKNTRVRSRTQGLRHRRRKASPTSKPAGNTNLLLTAEAWEAGIQAAAGGEGAGQDLLTHLQQLWFRHFYGSRTDKLSAEAYTAAAKAFVDGYCTATARIPPPWVMLPTEKSVAAVVTVMNEEETIRAVVRELERLPLNELIVIVNGSRDSTFRTARSSSSKAVIVHYAHALGHDVGRAIGARLTQSDMVLFVDGDFHIPAEKLIPFIKEIDKGSDIALNNISPILGNFNNRDGVSVVKEFLNRALGRPDLMANSLTAVPHALSRKAIEEIGWTALSVPPKAQALALCKGLRITAPASVDVITTNRVRKGNVGYHNPVSQLIVGDHLEAFELTTRELGPRHSFVDQLRSRQYTRGGDSGAH